MHHFGVVIYDEYFRTVVCTVILTYLVCHFLTVVQWKSHLLVLFQKGFLVVGIEVSLVGRVTVKMAPWQSLRLPAFKSPW